MFIHYHGYKLRVSTKGIASYVTPEIAIYKPLYGGRVQIYKGPFAATIEKETPLVEQIITGEFFDRLHEENPFIPKYPNSVKTVDDLLFDLYLQSDPFIKVTIKSDGGVFLTVPLRGKKMGSDNYWAQLDDDFRVYAEPRNYKTTYVPVLNGRVSAKGKVYLIDVVDKLREEIPVKTERPFIPSDYVETIDPDYVYINFKNYNTVYLIKKPLVIEYSEIFNTREAKIYYMNRVVKEITGKKTEIMNELSILAHAGDGILLL